MTSEMPRIERGTTYMVVPKGRFVSPAVGPGNYQDVLRGVKAKGLSLATGEQTASLLDEAYNSKLAEFKESPEADNVRRIMKDAWIWVPNRVLWTPKNAKNAGVYVKHDSEVVGLSERMDVNQLEDALSGGQTIRGVRFSKDGRTAFASANTITLESQKPDVLAQNGFVIASYGAEGAEQLGKVASQFTLKPYVWGVVNDTNEPIQRLSALVRGWFGDDRLSVCGVDDGGGRGGYSFGVSGSK